MLKFPLPGFTNLMPKQPKVPKMRSPVYMPSANQMGKGGKFKVSTKLPKIKIKSDWQ